MNSRILRAIIVIAPWILAWWVLRDVQQPLVQVANHQSQSTQLVTIIPVTISASRRDYPSVSENSGKGFIIKRDQKRSENIKTSIKSSDIIGANHQTSLVYTARHVISDTGYTYSANRTAPLTALYQLSGDLASAQFSGQIATGYVFRYTTGLQDNQVLMAQYRDDNWGRLTGSIVSSGNVGIIIDLPVIAGDSGSPVIFADKSLGVVSQSHSGDQAIIQKIR